MWFLTPYSSKRYTRESGADWLHSSSRLRKLTHSFARNSVDRRGRCSWLLDRRHGWRPLQGLGPLAKDRCEGEVVGVLISHGHKF